MCFHGWTRKCIERGEKKITNQQLSGKTQPESCRWVGSEAGTEHKQHFQRGCSASFPRVSITSSYTVYFFSLESWPGWVWPKTTTPITLVAMAGHKPEPEILGKI